MAQANPNSTAIPYHRLVRRHGRSTTLAQGIDPEILREVIRGFQDASAGAVVRFDG